MFIEERRVAVLDLIDLFEVVLIGEDLVGSVADDGWQRM